MSEQLFVSYKWIFITCVSDERNELNFNYRVDAIGSTYEEAKDIATHLLRKKNVKLHHIISVQTDGVKFAYYHADKVSIPASEHDRLPLPYIPPKL